MEWLIFIAGLGVGVAIGWHLKPPTSINDDPTGEIKQSISDKLDKAIQDIKNTI